jgi:hypothetical protein
MRFLPKRSYIFSGFLLGALLLGVPFLVHGATLDLGVDYGAATGLSGADIRDIVARIIQVALGLLGILALVIILYAGFLYLTDGGKAEQATKAKTLLLQGMIGLTVVLMAYTIVLFLFCTLFPQAGLSAFCRGRSTTPSTTVTGAQPGNPPLPAGAQYLVVTSANPEPDAMDVPRNTSLSVTFNDTLRVDTVTTSNPVPRDEDDDGDTADDQCVEPSVQLYAWDVTSADFSIPIYGSVSVRGNALTFKASEDCGAPEYTQCEFKDGQSSCSPEFIDATCCGCLLPSSLDFGAGIPVKIVLGTGLTGTSGKKLSGETGWTFTVSNRLETTKPQVASILPPNSLDPAVPRNIGVQVLFDKPIDPTTLITVDAEYPDDESLAASEPATVRVYRAADGVTGIPTVEELRDRNRYTLVPGNLDRSVDGFVFRPLTDCGEDAAGCFCFDAASRFVVVLADTIITDNAGQPISPIPGIRDNHCNALTCVDGSCDSQFLTTDSIDTTPPVVATQGGDRLYLNPIDPEAQQVGADRVTNVYAGLCDKQNPNDPGCTGYINALSINRDTFVLSDTTGATYQKNLPTAAGSAACCFPSAENAYGRSCPAQTRTDCPARPTLSTAVSLDPIQILEPLRTYYVTLYGGGAVGGSCSPDANRWGITDLAGNALIARKDGEIVPNQDWRFTTSDVINAGNPFIVRVGPAAGYPEQCISIIGANFGNATSITAPDEENIFYTANIPYDGTTLTSRCSDPLAEITGCKGDVYYRRAGTSAMKTAGKIYAWSDTYIVATLPDTPEYALDDMNVPLPTPQDVFVRLSW